ncbi:MAG TPA: hypothetical protein VI670_27780 [Thermoanaerobaculia bacterium]|jgi:hypothetical protein
MSTVIAAPGLFVVQLDRDELATADPDRDRHKDRRGEASRLRTEPRAASRSAHPADPIAERAAAAAHQAHVARCASLYIEPPITNYGRTA